LFEQGWLISERESERESARLIAGFSGSGKMKRERERESFGSWEATQLEWN